jgi:FAD/FMN-containing dehydrogenase
MDNASPELRNWDGSIVMRPHTIAYPRTVDELVAIMRDPVRYPSPIRAVGSNHTSTFATVSDGGTAVLMSPHFHRIIAIRDDTVTVEAGALYIDVAQELRRHGKQFHVNLEIGCLSMGVAASGGTKDSSFPGEYGQCSSYAIGFKLVTPSGELQEFTEAQPEMLRILRSSYGLLGIVYEVTFRVRPVQPMRVETLTFTLEEFEQQLPALRARGDSMFMYLFPHHRKINCEFRSYSDGPHPQPNGWRWGLRNYFWEKVLPYAGYLGSTYVKSKRVRYFAIDQINEVVAWLQRIVMTGADTSAADQLIRFPPVAGNTKYCFSLWAFPERDFPQLMRAYFDFCADYYREHGYRSNMLNVGYRIAQDDNALFSYAFDSNVMTFDPVGTGDEGWQDFLKAYNVFCSERGGRPLFNQTRHLTGPQARKAYGERIDQFNAIRTKYDPKDRMLNDFFAAIFSPTTVRAVPPPAPDARPRTP